MSTYNTRTGQNIFDLALQTYGDLTKTVQLFNDNNAIQSLNNEIPSGIEINFTEEQNEIRQYLIDKNFDISTSDALQTPGKGFDSGFDIGFN